MSILQSSAKRIAVIGSDISRLAAAHFLVERHAVMLFEVAPRFGGHTNTVDIEEGGQIFGVDTSSLVSNPHTYPNLTALFDELDVAHCENDMSFSMSIGGGILEWTGISPNAVLAQPRNLASVRFLSILRDILRFSRQTHTNLTVTRGERHSLGTLLAAGRYGESFRAHYLLPVAATIWSTLSREILAFPTGTFLRFYLNHGLLQVFNQSRRRTVKGDARSCMQTIASRLADVCVGTPVRGIHRAETRVDARMDSGSERHDAVVLTTHTPQTLYLLDDVTNDERAVLGAFRYQLNTTFLYRDTRLLPRRRRVWSTWNHLDVPHTGVTVGASCVSYLLNQLQPLPVPTPAVTTLNPPVPPASESGYRHFGCEHPVLNQPAIDMQTCLPALQGCSHTWFAGVWTGCGFYEDRLKFTLHIVADFGCTPAWAQVAP